MSAQSIYDQAPIGALIRYSDGTPRPPQHTRGNHTTPASFTMHKGEFGSAGVVVLKVFKTFSASSPLTFTVVERPKPGMVRVLDRAGGHAELLHLAADRAAAQAWLASHRYSDAVLDAVIDDDMAAGPGEGRAA